MAEKSEISWTDATFNPWWGCAKVSPACDNCYAERDSKRFAAGKVLWGVDAERRVFGDAHWNAPRKWNASAARVGKRVRVFCASMADVFDKNAPEGARDRLWKLIEETPSLDWLLLTKRVGNVDKMVPAEWLMRDVGRSNPNRWPSNAFIGSTVIDQEEADRDIPKLLELPAPVRFLSIEPMLGPINLRSLRRGQPDEIDALNRNPGRARGRSQIDWVIAGGESGNNARPVHPEWLRSLRNQCEAAGTPFHFKQYGEYSIHEVDKRGGVEPPMPMTFKGMLEWRPDLEGFRLPPADAMAGDVFKGGAVLAMPVGKNAAGRLLDGVEHNGFPGAPT